MIVCVCHRVTERDIEDQVLQGCASFDELQAELHVATACGACTECARETFDQACFDRAEACRPAQADVPAPRHRRVIPISVSVPPSLGA